MQIAIWKQLYIFSRSFIIMTIVFISVSYMKLSDNQGNISRQSSYAVVLALFYPKEWCHTFSLKHPIQVVHSMSKFTRVQITNKSSKSNLPSAVAGTNPCPWNSAPAPHLSYSPLPLSPLHHRSSVIGQHTWSHHLRQMLLVHPDHFWSMRRATVCIPKSSKEREKKLRIIPKTKKKPRSNRLSIEHSQVMSNIAVPRTNWIHWSPQYTGFFNQFRTQTCDQSARATKMDV
jgi:hypothetical protein